MGQSQTVTVPDEEMDDLLESTHFKKDDLQMWFKKFMKSYPDGLMNRQQFTEVYGKVYSAETTLSTNLFNSFDINGDGVVSFRELMITLSLSTRGTPEEKLQWLFNVYDIDGNGKITLDEVRSMETIFHKVRKGGSLRRLHCDKHHTDDGDKDDDYISCVFNDVDLDQNGYWTLDEFMKGVRKHPFLKKIIEVQNRDNVLQDC